MLRFGMILCLRYNFHCYTVTHPSRGKTGECWAPGWWAENVAVVRHLTHVVMAVAGALTVWLTAGECPRGRWQGGKGEARAAGVV